MPSNNISELNLTAYTATHRTRQRGTENGYVVKTGKLVKKWLGYYHDYRPNPDPDGKRRKRVKLSIVLGLVKEMTKGEAEDALRVFIRRRNSQPAVETPKDTVATLCDDYIELKKGAWEEDSTLKTNVSTFKLIKRGVGDLSIEAVQPEDLVRFINSLPNLKWTTPTGRVKAGYSDSQAHKCITYLRAIFKMYAERAARKGVVFMNPACSATLPLAIPKACAEPDKTVLHPTELALLFSKLSPRDRLILWLAVISLRPGEVFAMRTSSVGPGYAVITNSLSRKRKLKNTKTGKPKIIAVPQELGRGIQRWIEERQLRPDDLLFVNQNGKPMSVGNFRNRNLRGAARRAGIKTLAVDFQMIRRSFSTLAYTIERDVKSVQAQMGHSRPDMFLLEYAQPVDEVRQRMVQRVEDILLGKEAMPVDLTAKLGPGMVQ